MTPRALTTGSIRQLPSVERTEERKPHGPVTDLVRKERCGLIVFEGVCDGAPVCIAEPNLLSRPGHWTMRSSDRLIAEGPLAAVLGCRTGGTWTDSDGADWTLDVVGSNGIVALSRYRGLILYRVEGPLYAILVKGWRPEVSQ